VGDNSEDKSESLPTLFGSVIRDSYQEDEQAEILQLASQSSCELGFEKVAMLDTLDKHCIYLSV